MRFESRTNIKGKEVETWRKPARTGAICLGYGPEKTLYKCLELFEGEGFKGPKLLLDLSYPGNSPLKFEGWEVIKIKNLGTSKNIDVGWTMLRKPQKLICVEPDELPAYGWSKAALRLLDDPEVGLVTCTMDVHHDTFIPMFKPETQRYAAIEYVQFPLGSATPFPCTVISDRLLIHGLSNRGLYGDLEPQTQKKCYDLGIKVCHLLDFRAEHVTGEANYEAWKVRQGDGTIKETYEEWLQAGNKA